MPVPIIIAGPILRRVTSSQVCVWIALSQARRVTLSIWEGDGIKHDGSNARFNPPPGAVALTLERNAGPAIQFGQNLYIGLINATVVSPGLDPRSAYSYNLTIEDQDNPSESGKTDLKKSGLLEEVKLADLSDDDLLDGKRPILPLGYEKDALPSFVLPKDDPAKLVIAQGSCRKMHGHGLDALAFLDDIIADTKKAEAIDAEASEKHKLPARPQQLFLTGDQIYADDVPMLALAYASTLGASPLVGNERIRLSQNNTDEPDNILVDTINFPPHLRQQLVQQHAGFTSTAASSHLLSFQEFCGLYLQYFHLRCWNNRLFKELSKIKPAEKQSVLKYSDYMQRVDAVADLFLEAPDSPTGGPFSVLANIDSCFASGAANSYVLNDELRETLGPDKEVEKFDEWRQKTRQTLKKEVEAMAEFALRLPAVSRVLANVATYMIFDDHEVTDDWFLTQRWKNQTLGKHILGRDVMRNGLMAYAIFQDWGNVPDLYVPIDIPAGDGAPPATPSPRTQLIRLVMEYANRIAEERDLNTLNDQVLQPIETLLGMGATPSTIYWNYDVRSGPTRTYVLDTRTQREYPSLNSPPGLLSETALLRQTPDAVPEGEAPFVFVVSPAPVLGLSSFEELVQPSFRSVFGLSSDPPDPGILGGALEVDYEAWGFNVPAFERFLDRLNRYERVILLSGDVHYGFSSTLDYWVEDEENPSSRIVQFTSSSLKNMFLPTVEILHSGLVQRLLTGFDSRLEKVGWKDKLLTITGEVAARNRARLRENPAVVPTAGWAVGAGVDLPPDFRWRINIVGDESVREGSHEFSSDIDLDDPASVKAGYKQMVERHLDQFRSGISRRVVWLSNLAIIRFSPQGESWNAHQDFFVGQFDETEEKFKAKAYIKHQVSLEAEGADRTPPTLG